MRMNKFSDLVVPCEEGSEIFQGSSGMIFDGTKKVASLIHSFFCIHSSVETCDAISMEKQLYCFSLQIPGGTEQFVTKMLHH